MWCLKLLWLGPTYEQMVHMDSGALFQCVS
jgi:hypothetical protein